MRHRAKLDIVREVVAGLSGLDPAAFVEADEHGEYLDLRSTALRLAMVRAAAERRQLEQESAGAGAEE